MQANFLNISQHSENHTYYGRKNTTVQDKHMTADLLVNSKCLVSDCRMPYLCSILQGQNAWIFLVVVELLNNLMFCTSSYPLKMEMIHTN